METYEQFQGTTNVHGMNIDNVMNCMICHGPTSYLKIAGKNNASSATYISHTFMNYMHYTDPSNDTKDLKAFRKKRIKLFYEARNK